MPSFFEQLELRLCLSGTGLRGDYYQSSSDVFSSSSYAVAQLPVASSTSTTVDASASSAASEIRWSGEVESEAAGNYVFHVITNGGVRLWVNNQLIVNNWSSSGSSVDRASSTINLSANTQYNIRLDVLHPTTGVELEWVMPNGTKQVIPEAQLYPFSQPISITNGGIFVGSWKSTNQSVPAVGIHTTYPVTIEDSTIEATGELIQNTVPNTQVTVINNTGYGLDPTTAGERKGDFFYDQNAAWIDVEHNTIIGVGGYGIKVYGFTGKGTQTIKIQNNYILDSDGRDSNGAGGYETVGVETHAIGIQNVYNVPGMMVAWNYIENDPGACDVNDVVNLFEVSGTAASPMNVENNYIDGLYDLNIATEWDSGAGITTDGDPVPTSADESAYIKIHNNQVIQTGSAGIGVPTGHNISVYANQLVNTGYLPSGTAIFASGMGVYIDNLNKISSSLYYSNGAYDNISGWVEPPHSQQNGSGNAEEKNYSFVSANSSMTYGNTNMSGTIGASTLAAQLAFWQSKLSTQKKVIGATALPTTIAQLSSAIAIASSSTSAASPSPAIALASTGESSDISNSDVAPVISPTTSSVLKT